MSCEEIKKIIPKYFKHQACDVEIKMVEEHLCICHNCRTELGKLMDNKDGFNNSSEDLNQSDNIKENDPIKKSFPEIKIISEEEITQDIEIQTDIDNEENVFTADSSKENKNLINKNRVNSKIEYVSPFETGQSITDKKDSIIDKGGDDSITDKNTESENIGEKVRISFEDEFGKYGTEDSKFEETISEELGGDEMLDLTMSKNIDTEDLEKEVFSSQNQAKDISNGLEEKQNNKKNIKKIEPFEYISLTFAIIVLIFVVWLLMRG
ncbi:MAG: hypothetical protein KAS51_06250 [Candidatus Omnitrophica bacterium]|nr:hypothetical protein [Candidatus Omnitrophota bacterium]